MRVSLNERSEWKTNEYARWVNKTSDVVRWDRNFLGWGRKHTFLYYLNRVLRIIILSRIIWIITRGFLIFPQFLNRSCSLCFTYWRSSMGHGHILLDFPYFLVLDFEKANFVWKQVSKPRCKLLVKNKQHKQLIDHTKPDDVHFLVSNSSFLLPFWFIRRHFNQKFNHFSLSSSLKPAPGMSPGIRSTWSPPVLVISNLPQGPKAHFQATSGFFF